MCAKRYYYGDVSPNDPDVLEVEPVTIKRLQVLSSIGTAQVGYAGLAFTRESGTEAIQRNTIAKSVSDGDTLRLGPFGNLSVRFLGIDTPEKQFRLLKSRSAATGSVYTGRYRLDRNQWNTFLADPFVADTSAYLGPNNGSPLPKRYSLSPGLANYLMGRLVPGQPPGTNHYEHAVTATKWLVAMITKDLNTLEQPDNPGNPLFSSEDEFNFYLRFGCELIDGYGRLLCILKPNQDVEPPGGRAESYNMRMLRDGMAIPYFIWPNIAPWREQEYILNAVIKPGTANATAKQGALGKARRLTAEAQDQGVGIYGSLPTTGPLQFMPHEIRFLSSMRIPPRYVIDLREEPEWPDTLLDPENYYQIPNVKDRLYIPVEYVPLFVKHGWKVQLPAEEGFQVVGCSGFCGCTSGVWGIGPGG